MGGVVDTNARWPEVWAGLECSHLRVRSRVWDQVNLTGHDQRPGDIDLLRRLGAKAVRYPVLWGRAGTTDAATDGAAATTRVASLMDAGMAPIVGLLHHGYGPRGQDPRDPDWPAAVARYAATMARGVPAWAFLPVNEPLTTARFGGLYGLWPPYAKDEGVFADLLLAHAEAARLAARAIRRAQPSALIIANEDCGRTEGAPVLRSLVEHYELRRWLAFDLLSGRVDREHPFWSTLAGTRRRRYLLDGLLGEPEIPDVLGIDYYVTSDRYLLPSKGSDSNGRSGFIDVELVRVDRGEVGFRRPIREVWERYRRPVALTEVHLAGEPHDQVTWWAEAWADAVDAVACGIPVLGVTAWAAFGALDWSSLLCEARNDYVGGCFDVRDGPPRATPLGLAVARTARGRAPTPRGGWWRSPDRVTVRAVS